MTRARHAKHALAELLGWTGILALLRRRRARRGEIAVLAFHRIAGTPDGLLPLAIPSPWFERLVHEAARRYRIGPWQAWAEGDSDRRSANLALTFDDGYREHAELVWPMLRRCGATGIFCLATELIDGGAPWWEVVAARHPLPAGAAPRSDRGGNALYSAAAEAEIARLKTLPAAALQRRVDELRAEAAPAALAALPGALGWAEARRLLAEGAEIAAHGVTHAVLTVCDDATLAREIDEGRRIITERTGTAPLLLAYPNGDCDDRVVAAARRAGFRWAFTVEPGCHHPTGDPLRVPRFVVTPAMCSADGRTFSWPLFEAELLGVFAVLLLRRWRS